MAEPAEFQGHEELLELISTMKGLGHQKHHTQEQNTRVDRERETIETIRVLFNNKVNQIAFIASPSATSVLLPKRRLLVTMVEKQLPHDLRLLQEAESAMPPLHQHLLDGCFELHTALFKQHNQSDSYIRAKAKVIEEDGTRAKLRDNIVGITERWNRTASAWLEEGLLLEKKKVREEAPAPEGHDTKLDPLVVSILFTDNSRTQAFAQLLVLLRSMHDSAAENWQLATYLRWYMDTPLKRYIWDLRVGSLLAHAVTHARLEECKDSGDIDVSTDVDIRRITEDDGGVLKLGDGQRFHPGPRQGLLLARLIYNLLEETAIAWDKEKVPEWFHLTEHRLA